MYKTRHKQSHGTGRFFVLTTEKKIHGEPLTGKFYGEMWEDGETIEPISYREAMRIARIRGLQSKPWEESKAYKKLVTGTPIEPTTPEEVVEKAGNIFGDLKKLVTGENKTASSKGRRTKKK